MAYRSYEKRESVYLNIEEAELIKEALYDTLGEDINKRDLICALIVELNGCIEANKERELQERIAKASEPFTPEELTNEA